MLKEFSALLLEFSLVSPLWFPPVLSPESLGSFRLSFCIPGLAAVLFHFLSWLLFRLPEGAGSGRFVACTSGERMEGEALSWSGLCEPSTDKPNETDTNFTQQHIILIHQMKSESQTTCSKVVRNLIKTV